MLAVAVISHVKNPVYETRCFATEF